MKQKIRKVIVQFTMIMTGIFLYSCQEDQIENFTKESPKFSIKESGIEELFKQSVFKTNYQKIKEKARIISNKTGMEQNNNFDIVAVPAKIIETNSIISYTLLIKRESNILTNSFENLVITISKSNEETKAAIVKYNLETPAENTIHNSIKLTGNIEISPIVYDPNEVNSLEAPCNDGWVLMCCNDGTGNQGSSHPAGSNCTNPNFLKWEYVSCSANTGGGDSSGGPTPVETTEATNPYPGGGASGTITATVPPCVKCPTIDTSDSTPCDKIKSGTSSTQYMNSFNNINKPSTLALPFEYGFAQVNDSYIFSQAPVGESIPIPSGAKNYTHTHPNRLKVDINGESYNGNVKIHAPLDILALLKKCQSNNLVKTDAFGVVISDEGIFALTILEPIELTSISITKWKEFEDTYDIKTSEIISNTMLLPNQVAIRKELMQKYLLKELKKLGLENKIGLFEGTIDNSGLAPKINWQRKKLNTSGSLTNEDC